MTRYTIVQEDIPILKTGTFQTCLKQFSPNLRITAGMYSTANEIAKWIIDLQIKHLLKEEESLKTPWTSAILKNGKLLDWRSVERLLNWIVSSY